MIVSVPLLYDSLSERDRAILVDVERFRLLSTRHIQRLHFVDHATTQAATRATHRVMQRLEQHGTLVQLKRRVGGPQRGSAAALWQLGPRAMEAIRPNAVKRTRFREPTSGLFVRHTVEVAELAVQIIERARSANLEVLKLNPEQHAWTQFLGRQGQSEWLRPDLYAVTASADFEQHTFLEVDRATEHGPQIIRKCHTYTRFADLGAADRSHGLMPRVVWVVPDAARQALLRRLIQSEKGLGSELFSVVSRDESLDLVFEGLTAETTTINPIPKGGEHAN